MGFPEGRTNVPRCVPQGQMLRQTNTPLFDIGLEETIFKSVSEVLRAFAFH